jgi:hypothetical protein
MAVALHVTDDRVAVPGQLRADEAGILKPDRDLGDRHLGASRQEGHREADVEVRAGAGLLPFRGQRCGAEQAGLGGRAHRASDHQLFDSTGDL